MTHAQRWQWQRLKGRRCRMADGREAVVTGVRVGPPSLRVGRGHGDRVTVRYANGTCAAVWPEEVVSVEGAGGAGP